LPWNSCFWGWRCIPTLLMPTSILIYHQGYQDYHRINKQQQQQQQSPPPPSPPPILPLRVSPKRTPNGTFNGYPVYPVYYHDLNDNSTNDSTKPYSLLHCLGENYQNGYSWRRRSCHFRFLCFDIDTKEFTIYPRPEDLDMFHHHHSDLSCQQSQALQIVLQNVYKIWTLDEH
jgi:hypothetical protein